MIHRPAQRALPAILGAVALGLSGCAPDPSTRDLLLIVIDTLRADHVSAYSEGRATSPAIDALARRGVRFERAYSTSSWTQPAMASIFTGRYPSSHGANGVESRLEPVERTLAEELRTHGYATRGIVSHVLLGRRYGFDQGFDEYREDHARGAAYISTPGVTEQALTALAELTDSGQPFFLFVHYFDPHYHYRRHPEVGFAAARAGRLDGTEKIRRLRKLSATLSPDEVSFLRDLYDEEIRFTDDGVGRLLTELQRSGRADRTVVAVTSDHGEEFLERGWLGHTRTLYEELVRVPLVIDAPMTAGGRTVETPVSTVDLAPTLLDLVGVAGSPTPFPGRSFAESVREATEPDPAVIYAEVDYRPPAREGTAKRTSKHMIVAGHDKLIIDRESGRVEWYDLDDDPRELRNLASGAPPALLELRALLGERAAQAAADRHRDAAPTRALGEHDLERLRDLGYAD